MINLCLIRKLLAGWFLLLFAFGITPKRSFHNLVANHKDYRAVSSLAETYQTQVAKTRIYCHCENLVTESPFVSITQPSTAPIAVLFIYYQVNLVSYQYSSDLFCASLRGPPVC